LWGFILSKKPILRSKRETQTWILREGEKPQEAEVSYTKKGRRRFKSFYVGNQVMFSLFMEFGLTPLERDVVDMLLESLKHNNIVFYSEEDFADTLAVNTVSVRRCMAKLKKLNLIKKLYRGNGYTALRFTPYLIWKGDEDVGDEVEKTFPMIKITGNKERLEMVRKHRAWIDKVNKQEKMLSNENLYAHTGKRSSPKNSVAQHGRHAVQ